MNIILLLSLILLSFGIVERRRHERRLNKIPVRIHVNGTRGKSMLTKMIVNLFRNAGISVVGKVTGERPQFYSNKKKWQSIHRKSPVRIREQLSFIKKNYSKKFDALIIENMALAAENQFVSESLMIQSTLSIITNIRPDHQEEMGLTQADVATHLSLSLPEKGVVFIPENEINESMKIALKKMDSKLISVKQGTWKDSSNLPVFYDQLSLLKQIQTYYKISDFAFAATLENFKNYLSAKQLILPFNESTNQKKLINLFSCNDVVSAEELFDSMKGSCIITQPDNILLTCRLDRPLRTIAFLRWIIKKFPDCSITLAGSFPFFSVKKILHCNGKSMKDIYVFRKIEGNKIVEHFNCLQGNVLGLGNFVGAGEKIITCLQKGCHDN